MPADDERVPPLSPDQERARAIATDKSLSHDEALRQLKELDDDYGYSEMVTMSKMAQSDEDPEWVKRALGE
jgi:hypothetical protein